MKKDFLGAAMGFLSVLRQNVGRMFEISLSRQKEGRT
jgi:hypothetical protein